MIAGQEHRESLDAVLPFLAQAQNQCLELGRDAMRADAGPAPVFAQAWGPEPSVSGHPEVELAAGDAEEPTGEANVTRHLLVVYGVREYTKVGLKVSPKDWTAVKIHRIGEGIKAVVGSGEVLTTFRCELDRVRPVFLRTARLSGCPNAQLFVDEHSH